MESISTSNFFYETVWTRVPCQSKITNTNSLTYLIFIDETEIGLGIVNELKKTNTVYTVKKANTFSCNKSINSYALSPVSRDDYKKLIKDFEIDNIKIDQVVYLWLINEPEINHPVSINNVNYYQDVGFLSLLYIVQELSIIQHSNHVAISAISNGIHSVLGDEELYPEKATIQGLIKCIPQEYPRIRCRYIDINPAVEDKLPIIKNLIDEIQTKIEDTQIAFRNGMKWIRNYEKIATSAKIEPDILKQNGTYLITGGLGSIGLLFAEYLAKTVNANLILLGRSGFLERTLWDHWLKNNDTNNIYSQKILQIKRIESFGGKVCILKASVEDQEQMQQAFHVGLTEFRTINGVFHLAGETKSEGYSYITNMSQTHLESQLKSKVQGLLVLNDVINKLGSELDFVFLSSSLSTILGGLQLGAYAAANAFMDVFAKKQDGGKTIWFCPNWEGCSANETKESLCRVLSTTNVPHLVMAISDLHTRLAQWIKIENLHIENEKNIFSKIYILDRN